VGENSPLIRAVTLRGLERRGIILDEERNKTLPRGEEGDITTPDSPIRVFVIPTDEERVFVEDAVAILNGTYAPPDRFVYSFQQTTYKRA
jgi:acetate kinase